MPTYSADPQAHYVHLGGPITIELSRRVCMDLSPGTDGHASPQAALIYQHTTADGDRAFADAGSDLANGATLVPIRHAGRRPTAPRERGKPLTSPCASTPNGIRTRAA